MGRIDIETKDYVKRPEIFADLFNYLIYDGKGVIRSENLSELDANTAFIPLDEQGKAFPIQKYRDVLKTAVVMEDSDATYALILGVENQTEIHYAMPVRNMGYDAYNYAAQVTSMAEKNKKDAQQVTGTVAENGQEAGIGEVPKINFLSGLKKEDKITPVITLVVYFGQKTWDGPMSIHEMMAVRRPDILNYVPDYRINIIAPVMMENSEIDKFTTSFRELAAFIRCGRSKQELKELVKTERFRHLDPLVANIANDVTNSGFKLKVNEEGEVDMCLAAAELKEEGRAEGEDVVCSLIQKLLIDERKEDIQKAVFDPAFREKLMREYALI